MTKISQLSSIGDSLAVGDQFLIRDIDDAGSPNKSVTVSGITRALDLGTAAAPAIAFATDKNSGIFSPGADQVAISTNGTGRLFVDASGNVGIGATPATILDAVAGSGAVQLRVRRSDSADVRVGADTGLAFIGTSNNHPVAFRSNNSEVFRITSAGLVGLGTSSPQQLLHVHNSSAADARLKISNGTTGSAQFDGLEFNCGSTGLAGIIQWEQQPLYFYTNNGTAVDPRLAITAAGNVGIGTTSPKSILTAAGNIVGLSETTHSWQHYQQAASSYTVTSIDSVISGATGSLVFNTGPNWTNANAVERARIDSSGRLLVGTSSARTGFFNGAPVTPNLQLEGTGFNSSSIALVDNENATSGGGVIIGRSRGTSLGSVTILQSGDTIGTVSYQAADGTDFVEAAKIEAFVDGTPGSNDMPGRIVLSTTSDGAASPTEAVRINSSQQLLVGTTASLASFNDGRLEVSSKASQLAIVADATASSAIGIGIRGNTSTTAVSFFNASDGATCGTIVLNSGSTSYNTSSDYRLKENVAEVTDGITRLQQLKPSRFNFIADPNKTVDGFIAHEVQDIVPEAITGDKDAVDDEGNPVYQGIDQSKLVPLLTAALQEALQKIEDLEGRLTAAGL